MEVKSKVKQIILATKNPGKAKEFKEIFQQLHIEIVSLLDLEEEVPDVEETGATFEENARLKAEAIMEHFQLPTLADDSGLVVDALGGEPGVYSARYAGLEKNDQQNVEKVLHKLKDVEEESRTARFVCVLALARPNGETITKKGTCEGVIGFNPKGDKGFGYDPIFIPKGYTKTLAEMNPEQKNQISHRRNAIDKMIAWLKEQQ